jgi:hypothetical protein
MIFDGGSEDEKVSLDELQEKIGEDEDHVQSTDVAAMQSRFAKQSCCFRCLTEYLSHRIVEYESLICCFIHCCVRSNANINTRPVPLHSIKRLPRLLLVPNNMPQMQWACTVLAAVLRSRMQWTNRLVQMRHCAHECKVHRVEWRSQIINFRQCFSVAFRSCLFSSLNRCKCICLILKEHIEKLLQCLCFCLFGSR